jgi:hypothetical protein
MGRQGAKAESAQAGAERQRLAAGDETGHASSSLKAGRPLVRQAC